MVAAHIAPFCHQKLYHTSPGSHRGYLRRDRGSSALHGVSLGVTYAAATLPLAFTVAAVSYAAFTKITAAAIAPSDTIDAASPTCIQPYLGFRRSGDVPAALSWLPNTPEGRLHYLHFIVCQGNLPRVVDHTSNRRFILYAFTEFIRPYSIRLSPKNANHAY